MGEHRRDILHSLARIRESTVSKGADVKLLLETKSEVYSSNDLFKDACWMKICMHITST